MIASIDVAADGPTVVVKLAPYEETHSIYKSSESFRSESSAADGFNVVDTDVETTLSFNLLLEGIGISLIDKTPKEMLYLSCKNLDLSYRDSKLNQTIGLKLHWIQVSFVTIQSDCVILIIN